MSTAATASAAAGAATLINGLGNPPAALGAAADELRQRAEHLEAVQECLKEHDKRAAAALQHQSERQATLQQELADHCTAAEQQQDGIAAALAALAARLDCLADGSGSNRSPRGQPPLLSLDLPDAYARACNALLDSLAGYVQHHLQGGASSGGSGGSGLLAAAPTTAAQQPQLLLQRQQLELKQLQSFCCKEARQRVEEEAEIARLQAELQVLRAAGGSGAASIGLSAADLEAEVASLQRRHTASLAQALAAAEHAAATTAGAAVVEEQAQQRQAVLQQRLRAKQQVADVLIRHLSRQLLLRQLLQHERATLQQVHAMLVAATQDAELALQATLQRLTEYGAPAAQQQQQKAAQQGRHAQESSGSTPAPAAATAAVLLGNGDRAAATTAEQLLACRAQLQQLSEELHGATLPAHRAVFAQLHALLYKPSDRRDSSTGADGGGNSAAGPAAAAACVALQQPQLSAPGLEERLAAVAAAREELSGKAQALLAEYFERSEAPAERLLARTVLLEFWGAPQRLAARAEKQRRRLESYTDG